MDDIKRIKFFSDAVDKQLKSGTPPGHIMCTLAEMINKVSKHDPKSTALILGTAVDILTNLRNIARERDIGEEVGRELEAIQDSFRKPPPA